MRGEAFAAAQVRELEERLNAAVGRAPRGRSAAIRSRRLPGATEERRVTRAVRPAYEELLLSPVGALARYRDADGRPLCGEAIISTTRSFGASSSSGAVPIHGPAGITRCR